MDDIASHPPPLDNIPAVNAGAEALIDRRCIVGMDHVLLGRLDTSVTSVQRRAIEVCVCIDCDRGRVAWLSSLTHEWAAAMPVNTRLTITATVMNDDNPLRCVVPEG